MKGIFLENEVIVSNEKDISRLLNKGYGEKKTSGLLLDLFEALFLMEHSKLEIKKDKKKINPEKFIELCSKKEKNYLKKYFVFSNLRKKGYCVKTGLKFGFDFRIYPKGKKMGEAHSEFTIKVIPENRSITMHELSRIIRMAQTLNTIPLMAVADNEGDVIYFSLTRKII